jgi:DNA-binding transcriptional MocR family regulator
MSEKRVDIKFVMVSQEFLECIRFLSPQAPSVWNTLLRYWFFKKGSTTKRVNEWVCPSKHALELRTGISENTIEKIIKELKILGFIKKIEQRRYADTIYLSNYYFLDDHPQITQAKLDELMRFRNIRRAKEPIAQDQFDYELYGDQF